MVNIPDCFSEKMGYANNFRKEFTEISVNSGNWDEKKPLKEYKA